MTNDVPPPESDELFDGNDPDEESNAVPRLAENAAGHARYYHNVFDQAKIWAHDTQIELLVTATQVEDDDPEQATQLREIAGLVQTVAERVEQGDTFRSRQPRGGR